MFLHIGRDISVEYKKILGIFDFYDTKSPIIKQIINKKLFVDKPFEYISKEDVVSCIVTDDKIFFSNISSSTLKKRAENLFSSME